MTDLDHLETLHRRLLWLSCWTIHNANHLRPKGEGDVKVGGIAAQLGDGTNSITPVSFVEPL